MIQHLESSLIEKDVENAWRSKINSLFPESKMNTWDAGWYQIKLILKQFYADDLKVFTKKYKEFEDRMRPLVYELGFLRK